MELNLSEQQSLDVKNLCSRKLFELLSFRDRQPLNQQQRLSVQQELIARRHYLSELSKLRIHPLTEYL